MTHLVYQIDIIYFMVPVALALGLGFATAFAFAVRRGQFEDLETPAYRILFDEPAEKRPSDSKEKSENMNSSRQTIEQTPSGHVILEKVKGLRRG